MNTVLDERFTTVIDRTRFTNPHEFTDAIANAIQSRQGAVAVVGPEGTLRLRSIQAAITDLGLTSLVAPGATSDFSPAGPVAASLNQTASTGTPESVVLVVTDANDLGGAGAEDLARTQAHLALAAVVAIFTA